MKNLILLVMVVAVSVCPQLLLQAQEIKKIRIDPTRAYGGTVSEFFEHIEYIPLETTNESVFGAVIQQVITDRSIVVADKDTRSVLFFTNQGRFIVKDKLNSTPGTMPVLSDDKTNRQITCLYSYNGKLWKRCYDYSGHIVDTKTTELNRDLYKMFLLPIGGGAAALLDLPNIGLREKNQDTVYCLKVYRDDNTHKAYEPLLYSKSRIRMEIAGQLLMTYSLPVQNGSFYYSTLFDNRVYKVNKDTAIPSFQFILPEKMTYAKNALLSQDSKALDSLMNSDFKRLPKVIQINQIFNAGKYLFFKLCQPQNSYQLTGLYNFIVDTVTAKLVCLDKIKGDNTNGFLPVSDMNIALFGLRFDEHNNIYSNVSSLTLFQAFQSQKISLSEYPLSLQKYFTEGNRNSNPVIVKMKLKY